MHLFITHIKVVNSITLKNYEKIIQNNYNIRILDQNLKERLVVQIFAKKGIALD